MRIFRLFPLLKFVFFKPSQIRLPHTFSPGTEWINFHNLDASFLAEKKKKRLQKNFMRTFDSSKSCLLLFSCVCNKGTVRYNGDCVLRSSCPCFHHNKPYEIGSTIKQKCNKWWEQWAPPVWGNHFRPNFGLVKTETTSVRIRTWVEWSRTSLIFRMFFYFYFF